MARKIFQGGIEEGRARDAQAQARDAQERRSGRKVKSRKQAIAIGLAEARREGKKVPKKKSKR